MTVAKPLRYKPGMVYAVPLADGTFGVAQAGEAMWPNIIYVALYLDRHPDVPAGIPSLQRENVVSLVATWKKSLNKGAWLPLGITTQAVARHEFPNEAVAGVGYVGAKHYDAGILAEFLSACHGLLPWNVMADPTYYDRLLAPGITRPDRTRMLDDADRVAYRRDVFGTGT